MRKMLVVAVLLALAAPLLASAVGTSVETVTVQSTQQAPVYSTNVLEAGTVYLLEASGTYGFGSSGTRVADAECYREPAWDPGVWEEYRSDWPPYGVLDMLVDPNQGGAIDPDWGACNPTTHVYTMCYEGQDRTASFVISDWYHTDNTMMGDNSGSLTVEIYELGCVAAWLPPLTNAEFALQDGTTLPIKFQLCEPGDFSSELTVTIYVPAPDLRELVFTPKYDPSADQYIVNFHTKDFGDLPTGEYTVEVGRGGCGLGSYDFFLEPKASRGNSGK